MFLQQKIQEQVACIDKEDRDSYIQRIQKKEIIQMKHKIIKARVKEDQVALTCVEMLDRCMKMGKETTTTLVECNMQHFQQPIRNGATAAKGGEAFSKGLRPHETLIGELSNNSWANFGGTLDKTVVQNHELPFYDALRSTTNKVLGMILEEYTEKEFHEYWAKINKLKSSSPSGRYVGLYKTMAISVTDLEM